MLTLGIETSCDETAAAVVVDGRRIRSNVIASQVPLHRKYGGVVPEIASRRHLELVLPVVAEALEQAEATLVDLGLVAVTVGPGLVGALLVGVSAAKAIAFARGLPLAGVNHLRGHVYANFLQAEVPKFPFVCLVVSGGHTDLIYLGGPGEWEVLGRSRDDAAGEAFDKVARILGLGYPGGPQVEALAHAGDSERIALPRAWLEAGSLDFSFSGLKTAVLQHWRRSPDRAADLAAGFQSAVVDVLVRKTMTAAESRGVSGIALAGGVASNRALREAMAAEAATRGLRVYYPPPELCTDNAAMIAAAGYHAFQRGERAGLDLGAYADLPW